MNALLLAAEPVTTRFEFGRIQAEWQWWMYAGILLAILAPLLWIYRRDAQELPWLLRVGLPLLRTAVLVGLLFIYLQPQWRSEKEEHYDSQVTMLVDTSASMNIRDADVPAGKAGQSRLQQVADALDKSEFLTRLRKKHQVTVIPFNSGLEQQRQIVLPKEASAEGDGATEPPPPPGATASAAAAKSWRDRLVIAGNDTRLGEALEQAIRNGRNTPLSGVVMISDGGMNAGAPYDTALDLARESHIPIFTIGIGSEKKPTSVSVAELNVPPRAFPNERFAVDGSVAGYGLKGRKMTVELLSREGPSADEPLQRGQGKPIESCTQEVTLGGDGEAVPVKFEVPPLPLGRHVLCLRIKPPAGAQGEPLFREGSVLIDNRKTRVLLFAGGPMRDYQYLRTMLFRDKSIVVDVLLQSALGTNGPVSQEASNLLTDFPTTLAQMAEYDCLVAFDPDWQLLKPEQVDLLYKWVDEQHGGMIAVAGPVNAGRSDGWVQNPDMAKVRKLYPVEFAQSFGGRANLMYGSEEPVPLEFTREGKQANYLWLGDSALASQLIWSEFKGVYSYCPVRNRKAGATVLARFGDSRTAVDGELPIYMAAHRVSASPVVYLGSGETWRLRRINPSWFDMLWTKLIRYAAQEHLRRQSARGSLVVDRDRYQVGASIEVRAELKNTNLGPLDAQGAALTVTRDGKDMQTLTMLPDPSHKGRFLLDLPVFQPGDFRLDLLVPNSSEHLVRTFTAVVPRLEQENPQRNAALLREIARKSGGEYYPELSAAMTDTASHSLVDLLKDASHTERVPLAPNPKDDEKLLRWALIALCSVMCLEWLIRRLAKLA